MIRVPKSDKETEKLLFSNAGNIFTVKRANLSSEKLDNLLFLMCRDVGFLVRQNLAKPKLS